MSKLKTAKQISILNRDLVIDEHLRFDVNPNLNKNASHTCMVYNAKPKDVLENASVTFFMRNYGTEKTLRYWAPGPAYVNLPSKVFDMLSAEGLLMDKKLQERGSGGKVYNKKDGIEYVAIVSKNNASNTVVFWSVADVNSPFVGLSSQFTIIPSKQAGSTRYVVTTKENGGKSFNRVHFCRSVLMSPVKGEGETQSVSLADKQWVNAVSNKTDALGYLTQTSILEILTELCLTNNQNTLLQQRS